jgi:hypothetical protein
MFMLMGRGQGENSGNSGKFSVTRNGPSRRYLSKTQPIIFMKINAIAINLLLLAVTSGGISNARAIASDSERRLGTRYEKQFKDLKQNLEKALARVDARGKTDYLAAREAETEAEGTLKEAKDRVGKLGAAKGLVGHAKGKWIGGAEKGIAAAKAKLKDAKTADERKAAEQELAKWEKNKREGLAALEERQAKLDEALKDKPAAEKALKEAREALAAAKARTMQALEDLGLEKLLTSDAHDGPLARFVVMNEATPDKLAAFAGQGREQEAMIEEMLADDALLIQMAVADGARGGNYGRAMEIYHGIGEASEQPVEGTLQRLALAISLEHATPHKQRSAVADTKAPAEVDPVSRYLQYEKAFLNDRLDPAFVNLSVWDMRHVVNGEEPDEISVWGREMLRTYRPDHITMNDYRWRYVALVRSDISYGSQNVKDDKDELQFFQNILMNGGICGRRAFIGRFMLRAFGIPTTARPQRGHAALAHWTPDGWVVCLGGGWGAGWTKTPYDRDRDFLATTQARATGPHYLRVKRAHWIADLTGEKRVWGLEGRHQPGFWNGVALNTQRALIEAADSKTLEAVGEDIAEASDTKEKIEIVEVEVTEDDRKIREEDGVIRIPAAATDGSRGIRFMDSSLGGKQLHYGRGSNSEFEYAFQSRTRGKHALVAKLATPSWKQSFDVTVNGDEVAPMPLPHTVGLWGTTEPIAVELKNGRNTLRFKRTAGSNSKGITIKEFKLVPWDEREALLVEEESASEEETGVSSPYQKLLATSLLQSLAGLSADGRLEPLPMDLSISGSRVKLLEARGSGILALQAEEGGKVVPVALEDLKLGDHALLARLVARLCPDDPTAHALAGAYMKTLGDAALAEDYQRKAGSEAVEAFTVLLEGAA